ncbi:MAG: hypothetical protein ACTSR0_05425 [Candidatus Asgardarchaeia archaeon]
MGEIESKVRIEGGMLTYVFALFILTILLLSTIMNLIDALVGFLGVWVQVVLLIVSVYAILRILEKIGLSLKQPEEEEVS